MKRCRKLTLRRETVRLLYAELRLVGGGHISRSLLSDCAQICATMHPDFCFTQDTDCPSMPAVCPM